MQKTEASNDNFDYLGFDSKYFIYNMGSLMIAWLAVPLFAGPILFLRCFNCCTNRIKPLKRLQRRLDNWMFWSYPITLFTESASVIYMCCLINLKDP
jgi:hypothetical protein